MSIQDTIKGMDVPQHKQDLEKNGNVVWLIENLGKRNRSHPQYEDSMRFLLNQASARNLMTLSEITKRRSSLGSHK